ncbi:MAG: sensor signal transduction histidine kinase, partial [Candidatus Solibacter sp.]|nr:sensor signal transduction histidine kinase [Candidatus Solibacter sp.]
PMRYSDGSTVHLAITRDVTSRKRVEAAALLLSAIVDSSDDAIISKDLDGIITSWNRSAERLFGHSAEEAVGQAVAALLIPEDRQEEEPHILARLRRGERVDHFQTKRKRKDGTLVDISLTVSPVKDGDGRIVGASKIARDITEQVRNQEALRCANESLSRSNADLEQFAYSASHDLQEPLRMVSIYSEMLQKRYQGEFDDRAEEYLSYIIAGGKRMERLLSDLRAFIHASLADDGPPPAIDAEAVLGRALANLGTAIIESGANITYDPLLNVSVHEFQLEQLFQNIIGNAIRYRSEATPIIHIAAQRYGNALRFSIQDNGIGIAPEYKEQIFGIFKRLHTTSDYPGTGMGLAICQRIVDRAGGRIWVESQPGRGSTFFFDLPAPKTH